MSLSSISLELADLNRKLNANNAKLQAQLLSYIPSKPVDHVFSHHETLPSFTLQHQQVHTTRAIQGTEFEPQSSVSSLVDNIHALALQSHQFNEEVKKDLMSSMSRAHGVENQCTQMNSMDWNASSPTSSLFVPSSTLKHALATCYNMLGANHTSLAPITLVWRQSHA